MKSKTIPLILIVLFASFQIFFGQEKPKAKLVDEFRKITSEDFGARLDILFSELTQKPNSTAYVVIHNGKVLDNRERFRFEQLAKGYIKNARFDEKRIYIIRAKDLDEVKIEFWVVPEGAEKPSFTQVKWDSALPPNAKPYIFTTTDWSERVLNPAAEYLDLNLFSEYLETNPTARGHFVVKARTKEEFRKEQTNITNLLVEKYKINSKRLKFFYIRENKPLLDSYPDVEVWLVPQKQKF